MSVSSEVLLRSTELFWKTFLDFSIFSIIIVIILVFFSIFSIILVSPQMGAINYYFIVQKLIRRRELSSRTSFSTGQHDPCAFKLIEINC